jgi:Mrp family chromosome partitioning ATPase
MAALADVTLMVVRYGKTTRTQVAGAAAALKAIDANLVGCVFNMVPRKGGHGYGYAYEYGYGSVDKARPHLETVISKGLPERPEAPDHQDLIETASGQLADRR